MNFKPLGSRVLLRVTEIKEVKIAGQTLTIAKGVDKFGKTKHEWDDAVVRAEVIKLGELADKVEVGDIVLVGGAVGVHVDGVAVSSEQDHRMVHEDDIIAIDIEATELARKKELSHA